MCAFDWCKCPHFRIRHTARDRGRERCLVHQPSCICCYLHSSIYTNQHIFFYTRSFAINDSKMTPIYFMQLFPFRTGWTRHTDRKGKTIQPFLRYTRKPASRSNCAISLCCYYFVWPTPNSPPFLLPENRSEKPIYFRPTEINSVKLGVWWCGGFCFYNLQLWGRPKRCRLEWQFRWWVEMRMGKLIPQPYPPSHLPHPSTHLLSVFQFNWENWAATVGSSIRIRS